MAELNGAWVPESEAEMEFIVQANGLAAKAYNDGVSQEDIVGGLSFLAATVSMQEPNEDALEDLPEPSGKREDCPSCGGNIEKVHTFIGTPAIISPCGCHVEEEEVSGWVDSPGDSDD